MTRSRRPPSPARASARAAASNVTAAAGAPRAGRSSSWIASAALAAALFGCYLWLAPPVSGDKDASEFALALAAGGVIHPTGYPIYTMLGHAFVQLLHRFGAGFPFAANAWAALGGGVAMYFYHRLALRFVPDRRGGLRFEGIVLATLPVLLLGFNPVWMVECTSVEVHSWQLAWLFGTGLFFVGTIERLEARGAPAPQLVRRMALWGFLCGLGGAHHATAIFMVAGMTAVLAWTLARARRFQMWIPLVWLAAGVVPLLSYGYIYYRAIHPTATGMWPLLVPSFSGTIEHVTALAYRIYLGHWAPDGAQAAWLRWHVHPYLWLGLALFAFQAFKARARVLGRVALGLLLGAVAQTIFTFQYGVGDPDAYFLPGLAVGFLAIPWTGASVMPALGRSAARLVAAAAIIVLALAAFMQSSLFVASGRKQILVATDAQDHALWKTIPYQRAIVLWPSDEADRLKQYQTFLHEKPGLDVYNTKGLMNPYARARFQARYGFDALALLDEAHHVQPTKAEFVIGQQSSEDDAHAFALVTEYMTLKAGIPVVAFDPPNPVRAWVPTPLPHLQGP